GQPATGTVEGGRIAVVDQVGGAAELGGEDVWIAPGFIDLQLNGYGGHDFNQRFWTEGESPTDTITQIVELAARSGTTMLCPTICTNSREAILNGLREIARVCESDARLAKAMPAIHVEGPYLASEDGPRGAHPKEHVRDPDWDEFQQFQEAASGRIKLFTLAPEREGALPFIEKLTAAGVAVSIGHTGAAPDQIRDAVRSG